MRRQVIVEALLRIKVDTRQDLDDRLAGMRLVVDERRCIPAVAHLRANPGLADSLRHRGRETAREYTWARVIDFLKIRLQFLGLAQGWGSVPSS